MSNGIDLERTRDSWFEEFSERWLTRGLLQLLPVGGPIDAMISGRVTRIQRERFELFAMDIYEELAKLDREKVDWAFFGSREGTDFFVSVLEQVLRTEHAEKLAALRTAFINGVTYDWQGSSTRGLFVRMLGISPHHRFIC